MRRLAVMAVPMLLCGVTACSTDTTVGNAANTQVQDRGQGRIGALESPTGTPTATAKPTVRVIPSRPAVVQTPAVRHPTAPPPPQAATFRVTIVSSAQGFDPVSFRVYRGTHVVVTNTDKVAHTFTSDTGTFSSGSIAPKASWTYVAAKDGTLPFHDETRPFASGQMQVYG